MRPPYNGLLAELAATDARAERDVRVGLLLPWANVAVETELPRLGLRHTVFHHARLVPASRTTAVDQEFWRGLRAASGEALDSLSHVELDGVLLACTSVGFTEGPELPGGIHTAFDALLSGLALSDASRVVLITPYPVEVTEVEAAAFARNGVEVLAQASLGQVDGYASVTTEQILDLVRTLPRRTLDEAEALVLSCTGWPTLPALAELEQQLRKPVFSSNLAMALLAVRLGSGCVR